LDTNGEKSTFQLVGWCEFHQCIEAIQIVVGTDDSEPQLGKSDSVSTEATPGIEDRQPSGEPLCNSKQCARGCLEPYAAQIRLALWH
jgi:hypothetical protein